MKKLSVKELYKKWAERYDAFNTLIFLEGHQPIKAIGKLRNKRVLDCGCGTGRNTIKMAKLGGKITGIDFSKEMLELAKKKALKSGLKIEFSEMDISKKWRFKNKIFDKILCNLVFNHIKNPLFIFKEMKRVSKKGTTIVITDVHPFAFWLPQKYQKEFNFFYIAPKVKIESYGFRHLMSDVVNCANKAGLSVVEIKEFFVTKPLKKAARKYKKYGHKYPPDGAVGVMYVFKT